MFNTRAKTVTPTRAESGAQAEALAARALTRAGLTMLARNVRCRGGEIDLIAEHGEVVVFIEVRLRRHGGFGGAAESIDFRKQARVVLAAQHWLMGAGARYQNRPCRFDVVLMSGLGPGQLEWIKDAFSAD